VGAEFKFDERLPTIPPEAGHQENPWRQVEVFTHGGELHLRIGAVNQENTGIDRYTVTLSKSDAERLIVGIQDGLFYLGR